jgi:hypothetical protein
VESDRLRVKAKLFPRKVIIATLKVLGIYDMARRSYRKLRKYC